MSLLTRFQMVHLIYTVCSSKVHFFAHLLQKLTNLQTMECWFYVWKQGVALTERNRTGPPCSVTVKLLLDRRRHDIIAWPARLKQPAGPLWSVTDPDRRQQTTTTDASEWNNTGPLGGPVIIYLLVIEGIGKSGRYLQVRLVWLEVDE